jgi:hypothetical protein
MADLGTDHKFKEQTILNRVYDDDSNSLNISSLNSLITVPYDAVYETEPTTSTEVYTYTKDGTIVGTLTVTYADATKARFVSAVLT